MNILKGQQLREAEAQDRVDEVKRGKQLSFAIGEAQRGQIENHEAEAERAIAEEIADKERINVANAHIQRTELEEKELRRKAEYDMEMQVQTIVRTKCSCAQFMYRF